MLDEVSNEHLVKSPLPTITVEYKPSSVVSVKACGVYEELKVGTYVDELALYHATIVPVAVFQYFDNSVELRLSVIFVPAKYPYEASVLVGNSGTNLFSVSVEQLVACRSFRFEQPENMMSIIVILVVSKPDKSSDVKLEQLANMESIRVTLAVSKPDTSSDVKLEQLVNM